MTSVPNFRLTHAANLCIRFPRFKHSCLSAFIIFRSAQHIQSLSKCTKMARRIRRNSRISRHFYLSIIRLSLLIELQLSHTWPSNTNEHVSHSLSTRMFLCTSLFSEYRTRSRIVYIPYITIVSSEGNFIYLPKQPQPLVTFSITEKLSIIGGTIFLRTTSISESSSPSSISSMME